MQPTKKGDDGGILGQSWNAGRFAGVTPMGRGGVATVRQAASPQIDWQLLPAQV
jgi:hypothetical protein